MPPTKSAHLRDLGRRHRVVREHLLSEHVDGSPCWWCGLPMYRDPRLNYDYPLHIATDPNAGKLHADHSDPRKRGGTRADRLLHGLCNKRRSDGAHDATRPAVSGLPVTSIGLSDTAQAEAIGERVLPWP